VPALQEIWSDFLKSPDICDVIEALANRARPVRRNELAAHFRDLHMFAIMTLHEYYERNNPDGPKQPLPETAKAKMQSVLAQKAQSIRMMEQLEETSSNKGYATELFYTKRRVRTDQLNFINLYNQTLDPNFKNKVFVFVDFPETYVDQIERLVYPQWYTACFMDNCDNSPIWGNYGTNHTGVCLRFKVENGNDKPFLRLNQICGINGDGDIYGEVDREFHKIDYKRSLVSIDFFRSLSRIHVSMLRRYWYRDDEGHESPCGEDIFKSPEAWRARHWENFYKSVSRKNADWEYENEYRLVIAADMLDFSSKESRKFKYKFTSLDGIIFGIKTNIDEKRRICKIIETKCREPKRDDFRFYQAYYDPRTDTIAHTELDWLKFG